MPFQNNPPKDLIETDFWKELKSWTDARIAMGHTGISQRTEDVLRFQLDHAKARDAVHLPLDVKTTFGDIPYTLIDSQAATRHEYLQRPDLGRLLTQESEETLAGLGNGHYDVAFTVSAGLSSTAIARNFAPFWEELSGPLARTGLSCGPLCYAEHGRVALGDHVAQSLGAQLSVVFIGERPGLSSPDSMGIYITYGPSVGTTDEARNCISNVRPAGQSYETAAMTLCALMSEAVRLGVSGVDLKVDDALKNALAHAAPDSVEN